MSFKNVITLLFLFFITPLQMIAQPIEKNATQQKLESLEHLETTKKEMQKNENIKNKTQEETDPFLKKMLFQDTTDILTSSLPLPYYSLQYTKTYSSTEREKSPQDSYFDGAIRAIKPTIIYHDYAKLKNLYETKEEQIAAQKIHELEKEAYMLQAQLVLMEKKKIGWLINPRRSGYYIGFGTMFGFSHAKNSMGINVSDVGSGGTVKLGYLRYFYNNLGLKAEIFGIYGGIPHNQKPLLYGYYGFSLSFLHDIPVFISNSYFGFFAGFGVGSYFFPSHEAQSFLQNSNNFGLNFQLGASWSYTKHHRIEIARIFTTPIVTIENSKTYNFEPSYIVSYSCVF